MKNPKESKEKVIIKPHPPKGLEEAAPVDPICPEAVEPICPAAMEPACQAEPVGPEAAPAAGPAVPPEPAPAPKKRTCCKKKK